MRDGAAEYGFLGEKVMRDLKQKIKKRKWLVVMVCACLFLLSARAASAQETPQKSAVEVPADELAGGVILKSGDILIFVKEEKLPGDKFFAEKEGKRVTISVTEPKPYNGKNILIPVEITDKELAKGVELTLTYEDGAKKKVQIPRRRVYLPTKFHVILPDLGEPGKNGGKNGALILEIHPKMTQDVRVDVSQTADAGIVIKVDYEDSLKTRFYDVLDQANKRDINLQYEYKTSPHEKWGIGIRNMLQAQNPRIVDIWRVQKLKENLFLEARLDNIKTGGGGKFGSNILYYKRNMELNVGNVDQKVENEFHYQLKFNHKNGNVIFRLQDFRMNNDFDFNPPGFYPKKAGAQLNLTQLPYGAKLSIGNLKVERTFDDLDEGKVDTKLNFLLEQEHDFGAVFPRLEDTFTWNVSTRLRLIGAGDEVWLQGRFLGILNFTSMFAMQFEINDDFLTLSGKQFHEPFQNRRLTFIKYRDFIEDRSILGTLGLDYAFVEAVSKRTSYDVPFYKKTVYKTGIGKSFTIFGLPLPLEIFVEKEFSRKNLDFGILASLRQWL